MAGNQNSGRRPKPTALKILEGNRGRRPLNENEPQPRPTAPNCPDWLHPDAKTKWTETIAELEAMGTLASSDQGVIAGYCQSFARWQQYEQAIDVNGPVMTVSFVTGSGEEVKSLKPSPFVKMAKDSLASMRAFATLLGLDPSSRSRLKVTPNEGEGDESGVLDAI